MRRKTRGKRTHIGIGKTKQCVCVCKCEPWVVILYLCGPLRYVKERGGEEDREKKRDREIFT